MAVLAGFMALLAAGCQTSGRGNWDDQVGAATYDDAVDELGPADQSAQLSDGAFVAQWLFRKGGDRLGHKILYGRGLSDIKDPSRFSDKYLNLTFGADGKLQSWRWSYK